MFCGYILYDTQLIVEMASGGDFDLAKHALMLYTDLVAIFVRIVIILLKNSNRKSRK
jgi:FtsH-binding integral membrane protein